MIAPAHDGLFTSGMLGEHSAALKELKQHQARFGGAEGFVKEEAED